MKKLGIVLATGIILSMPVAVYAATTNSQNENSNSELTENYRSVSQSYNGICGYGVQKSDLTEEQKADLDESFEQMMKVKREAIDKMIANGLMTKEEGAFAKEHLDEMSEYHEANNYDYGMGMMYGRHGNGRGMMGSGSRRGMRGWY